MNYDGHAVVRAANVVNEEYVSNAINDIPMPEWDFMKSCMSSPYTETQRSNSGVSPFRSIVYSGTVSASNDLNTSHPYEYNHALSSSEVVRADKSSSSAFVISRGLNDNANQLINSPFSNGSLLEPLDVPEIKMQKSSSNASIWKCNAKHVRSKSFVSFITEPDKITCKSIGFDDIANAVCSDFDFRHYAPHKARTNVFVCLGSTIDDDSILGIFSATVSESQAVIVLPGVDDGSFSLTVNKNEFLQIRVAYTIMEVLGIPDGMSFVGNTIYGTIFNSGVHVLEVMFASTSMKITINVPYYRRKL